MGASMHHNRGFSLIEALITVSVIAILALLSMPLFNSLVQKQRASGAAETLYNALQLAKSEAVKRNANVYVSFSTGNNWCYGINLNSACNCSISNNCGLASVSAPASQQLSLSTTGMSSNSIYFEGTHGSANSSSSVTFTVYGTSNLITVTIGRLGGITLCATGISGYTSC